LVRFQFVNMLRVIVSLFIALFCVTAMADPPVRVARLAYLHGPVSFSPAGTDDWALASLNRPLIAGDRVWTDAGGRDELQLGGLALRMDAATLLSILTLDDRALQVQLPQGTLNIRVRPGPAAGTVEVDTPNLALTIDQPGHYRISVDPSGNTTTVRVDDGQAQATGQYQAYAINPGQDFRFTGPDLRNVQALDPRYRDAFDRWCAERDRRADRAIATRYVSPAMIGYEDLDDYGSWRTVPDYGHVWIPRSVPRGWAPYRDGHWAWIEPWGWTWIDDEPWGFAVTHYGRWANIDNGWAWVPEPANAMPVYAPALVAFAAAGLLFEHDRRRGPDVAWFPLAPHEAYRPPYQASPRYLSAINFNAGNTPPATYRNRSVNGAVTAVPVNVFTRAQPVRGAGVAVPSARIAQAPVVVTPQVQAGRDSLASHIRGGRRPAQALLARPAMTRMQPAVAGAGHGPSTQVKGTPAPQPVPSAGRPAMGEPAAPLAPGVHGRAPQALPTPLPPNEARGAHRPVPPGTVPPPVQALHEQGRGGLPPGVPVPPRGTPAPVQQQQAQGRGGPPAAHAPAQPGAPLPPRAVQERGMAQHQREGLPGSHPTPAAQSAAAPARHGPAPNLHEPQNQQVAAPRPQEAAQARHEAMPGPRAAQGHPQPAPARIEPLAPPHEAQHPAPPRPQPVQAPQPRPEPQHPHAQPAAPRPEPVHVPPPAPPQQQPRPHPEPPHPQPQPQPHPQEARPAPPPRPQEARPAPQAQQHPPQGQPQHGHNDHKDEQH
jgi:hypothetical protein